MSPNLASVFEIRKVLAAGLAQNLRVLPARAFVLAPVEPLVTDGASFVFLLAAFLWRCRLQEAVVFSSSRASNFAVRISGVTIFTDANGFSAFTPENFMLAFGIRSALKGNGVLLTTRMHFTPIGYFAIGITLIPRQGPSLKLSKTLAQVTNHAAIFVVNKSLHAERISGGTTATTEGMLAPWSAIDFTSRFAFARRFATNGERTDAVSGALVEAAVESEELDDSGGFA